MLLHQYHFNTKFFILAVIREDDRLLIKNKSIKNKEKVNLKSE